MARGGLRRARWPQIGRRERWLRDFQSPSAAKRAPPRKEGCWVAAPLELAWAAIFYPVEVIEQAGKFRPAHRLCITPLAQRGSLISGPERLHRAQRQPKAGQ